MGEVMTQAIIGMPYDMAMSDELSRRQFHERAQYLLGEHEKLQAELAKLRAELERLPVDGWKLVPVEPTPEMVSAAEEAYMPFGDMDIALRMAILAAPSASGTAAKPDGLHIGAWRDALQKIAKYAPPVNHAARTEIERVGLIAVHALIAFSAPQFIQPAAHQEARNAAAPSAPKADDPVKVQLLEALESAADALARAEFFEQADNARAAISAVREEVMK